MWFGIESAADAAQEPSVSWVASRMSLAFCKAVRHYPHARVHGINVSDYQIAQCRARVPDLARLEGRIVLERLRPLLPDLTARGPADWNAVRLLRQRNTLHLSF